MPSLGISLTHKPKLGIISYVGIATWKSCSAGKKINSSVGEAKE